MERNFKDKDSKLLEALIQIQAVLLPISSNHPNDFTGKNYLDLPAIQVVAKPILSEHKVLMQQLVDVYTNEAGVPMVHVETELMNMEGEFVRCNGTLGATEMAKANATQKLGATISYLRRFQAMTVLGISGTDDDDESNMRPRPGDDPERETVQNGELVMAPEPDSIKDLRAAIQAIANEEVFTKAEALKIKESYMNARTMPELQKVLNNVQTAFTEKSGGSNE